MPEQAQDRHWGDLGVALLLAGLLALAWTIQNWANLAALRLPDTDDVVRLQQIRDWLGGQGFSDVAQHRLGPAPGLEMHWSRLPDLVPAALIALLAPVFGAHAAELAAILAWPALLFAAALWLVARIARALGASGPLSAVVAALAYPATTLFMPGRIDHHGFQMVLLLAVARAAIAPGSLAAGAGAGIATAASLAIGIETAPLLAIGGGAILIRWIAGGRDAQARLAGYAVALVLALAGGAALLRTGGWAYPACDGFTAQLWRGAQLAALAPLALAIYGFASPAPRARAIATLVAALPAVAGVLLLAPGCLHPYGEVDPLLARLWLANVAEAQPLFGAPIAHRIGYAGLMLAGIGAGVWAWRSSGDRRWLILLAFQCAALALTLIQLRGAYAGALLAAPALAALIAHARTRGAAALVCAWLISAGLLYPLLAERLAPRAARAAPAAGDCTTPAMLARLAALPPGTLIAPIDIGAFALAATPHRAIAAPYHRNAPGNLGMYRFFLAPPERARDIARDLGATYVIWCAGAFDELGRTLPTRATARLLAAGRAPDWLEPLEPTGEALRVYRIR